MKLFIAITVASVGFIFLFLGPLGDSICVDRREFVIFADQFVGGKIKATVSEVRRGFYLSGGHGWSIGSKKESYEVQLNHNGKAVRWVGPGVPIILQSKSDALYLATYDRETSPSKADFRCYRWNEQWLEVPSNTFPLELTRRNNLIRLDVSSESSVADELRGSLIGRFWFCVFNNFHDWEVSESHIDTNFITSYQAAAFRKK